MSKVEQALRELELLEKEAIEQAANNEFDGLGQEHIALDFALAGNSAAYALMWVQGGAKISTLPMLHLIASMSAAQWPEVWEAILTRMVIYDGEYDRLNLRLTDAEWESKKFKLLKVHPVPEHLRDAAKWKRRVN